MADDEDADRSAQEIQILLRNLDPRSGNKHRDRVKKIEKFQKYVCGGSDNSDPNEITTPEFYDDDLPLLFVGVRTEDEEEEGDGEMEGMKRHYGLLHACGAPSGVDNLKRSASDAMGLLKYLVIDHIDLIEGHPIDAEGNPIEERKSDDDEKNDDDNDEGGNPQMKEQPEKQLELNSFARALCSCTVKQLREMNLDLHVLDLTDETRSGAKKDACEVISLLIINHLAPDTEKPEPIGIDDLVLQDETREEYDSWLQHYASRKTRQMVRRAERIAADVREGTFDPSGNQTGSKNQTVEDFLQAESRKQAEKLEKAKMLPTQWEQTDLYKETVLDREARDLSDLHEERERANEEKARGNRRDPLGIRGENFDLMIVNQNIDVLVSKALQAFDHDDFDFEDTKGTFAKMLSLDVRREEFYDLLEKSVVRRNNIMNDLDPLASPEGEELGSILPTDTFFDPALFLSLVHGTANFKQLKLGLNILSGRQDSQVKHLRDIVKTNFDLFARCADGSIDLFSDESSEITKRKKKDDTKKLSASERLENIDSLAENCFSQARKSFKPLLDNSNEVQKVQSALAVLQRTRALLQVPTLMRQHLEAGRVSAAVKTFRRALIINDDCKIELLIYVKVKANEIACDMKRDLEKAIGNKNLSVQSLVDSIRDLYDLNESNLKLSDDNAEENELKTEEDKRQDYIVKNNLPSVACLMLQTAHFEKLVEESVSYTDHICNRIYEGDSSCLRINDMNTTMDEDDCKSIPSQDGSAVSSTSTTSKKNKRWRYDILEARVRSTARAVLVAREWLPRLLRIGIVAREAEKRDALKSAKRDQSGEKDPNQKASLFSFINFSIIKFKLHSKVYEVFVTKISPAVTRLVQHTTFCALGCGNRRKDDKKIVMTFGREASESLRALLRSPLPPKESARVSSELAELFEALKSCYVSIETLRPTDASNESAIPFTDAKNLAEEAVTSVEKRRCIFALDVCARNCYRRATGSGLFDADSLFQCLQKLAEEMCRPEECINEIEKGSQLVVRRCCEGLAEFVRDRGDNARLRAIAECAHALTGKIVDVIREISYLTSGHNDEKVEDALVGDILALESTLWHEFIESIRKNMMSHVNLNWGNIPGNIITDGSSEPKNVMPSIAPISMNQSQSTTTKTFPGYLATSLLAIIKCRSIVERALGDSTFRKSENTTYHELAMTSACDAVLDAVCSQIQSKITYISESDVVVATTLLNELQFLVNTIQKYSSPDTLNRTNSYLKVLMEKAGMAGQHLVKGDGPDGLAAIEELERLGRVYVLCFGE